MKRKKQISVLELAVTLVREFLLSNSYSAVLQQLDAAVVSVETIDRWNESDGLIKGEPF